MNRLTQIAYFDGQFADFTYTAGGQRDTASTRTQLLAVPQVTDYDYDPFQRLKLVTYPDARTVSYTYYDNDLRQTMITPSGTITYGYDNRGNLNKITNGAQVTNYTYNAADQLANVVLPDNTNIAYDYDADGRRVTQTVGSTTTNYLWDEASPYGDVVNEYNSSGTLASYVLGGTGLISQTRGTTTSYFLQDGQGSTRALTNSSSPATVTDTYSYTAFGELFNSSGTTVNPYRYTGQQFDSLTSLYSLRARYYNPALGRFLSQDTYPVNFNNPVELNRYVYTANDPINRMDPSGQSFVELAINLAKDTVVQGALLGAGLGAASAFLCGGNALEGALTGAVFGGAFAGAMTIAPALTAVIGLGGGALGLSATYQNYQENGLTACNFINGVASVMAISGSERV